MSDAQFLSGTKNMPEGFQPASLALVCIRIALVTLVLILGRDSRVLQLLSKKVKDGSVLIFVILLLVGSLAADVIDIGNTPGLGHGRAT